VRYSAYTEGVRLGGLLQGQYWVCISTFPPWFPRRSATDLPSSPLKPYTFGSAQSQYPCSAPLYSSPLHFALHRPPYKLWAAMSSVPKSSKPYLWIVPSASTGYPQHPPRFSSSIGNEGVCSEVCPSWGTLSSSAYTYQLSPLRLFSRCECH